MTLREQLLEQLSKPVVSPITFGGQSMFVKHWTETEKMAWAGVIKGMTADDPENLIRCRALVYALCDDNGKMIFTPDDFKLVAEFPSSEIAAAFDRIMEVNSEPDDNAKKNSQTTPA